MYLLFPQSYLKYAKMEIWIFQKKIYFFITFRIRFFSRPKAERYRCWRCEKKNVNENRIYENPLSQMRIECFYTPPDGANGSKKHFWKKSFSNLEKVRYEKNPFFRTFSHRAQKKGRKQIRFRCVLSFRVYRVHKSVHIMQVWNILRSILLGVAI